MVWARIEKWSFLRKGRFWRWQIIAAGGLLLSLIAEGVGLGQQVSEDE
jgi:hypothetical protein